MPYMISEILIFFFSELLILFSAGSGGNNP